ncbi:MAG: S49 family peptidase, partial [Pseudomonadota bacterium]
MADQALSEAGALSEAQMLRELVRDMNANSERRNEAQLLQQAKDRRSKNVRFGIMVLGIGSMLLFYMYGFFVLNGGLASSTPSGPYAAVVQLKGTIAEGSAANAITVSRGLSKAFKDPNAKGVVLYINSPGGSPVQSAIIYDRIQALKAEYPDKKIITVATDTIASGAFWVASATDAIYVDRSTIAGSIGVVSSAFGFSDLIERYGVERRVFTAGESKASLDSFTPVTDGDREKMAEILGDIHQ